MGEDKGGEFKVGFTFETVANLLNKNIDAVQTVSNVLANSGVNVIDGTIILYFIAISNAQKILGIEKEAASSLAGFIYDFSSQVIEQEKEENKKLSN